MSRPSRYESEYASSFIWDNRLKSSKSLCCNKNYEINTHSGHSKQSHICSSREHKYRHRLKQSLLEKLNEIEAELYGKKRIKSFVPSSRGKHESHEEINVEKKNEWRSEWERSRSVAAEVKQRNEQTQIWWLQDSYNYMDDYDDNDDYYNNNNTNYSRRSDFVEDKNLRLSTPNFGSLFDNEQTHKRIGRSNIRNHVSRSPSLIPQMSPAITGTNSNAEDKSRQSIFSRSSFSPAQATGYISTTDEVSSFNHDTDGRSIDAINNSTNNVYGSTNDEQQHSSDSQQPHVRMNEFLAQPSSPINIPKLDIPHNSSPEHTPINNDDDIVENETASEIIFYAPYQKEDFVKESPLPPPDSETAPIPQYNSETFRLEK